MIALPTAQVSEFLPFAALLLLPVAMVLATTAALLWSKHFAFLYVTILMLFPNSGAYGYADPTKATRVYDIGAGPLGISLVNLMLLGTWFMAVLFGRLVRRDREPLGPMSKYYIGFALVVLGNVLLRFGYAGQIIPMLLDERGVLNIVWQGMLVALLLTVIRTERDFTTLILLLLGCTVAREAFGLVRLAFFGGDPQNGYANLGVKITFWDINDAMLASLAFAYAAWKLLAVRLERLRVRVGYVAMMVLAALTPILSARRSSQSGFLLAALTVILLLPRGRRWPVVMGLLVLAPTAAVITAARSNAPGSIVDRLFPDVVGDRNVEDPRLGRFYELETAWNTVRESPVFGLGPSGSFKVSDNFGLEYHSGVYNFVHSGFGHVMMKTGLVGLALYLGVFLSYVAFVYRNWRGLPPRYQAPVVASMATVCAQMPTMLFGGPIIEIRTMMVLGLLFAIPFLAVRFARLAPEEVRRARPTRETLSLQADGRVPPVVPGSAGKAT